MCHACIRSFHYVVSVSNCYSSRFSAIRLSADWPTERKHIQSTVPLHNPAFCEDMNQGVNSRLAPCNYLVSNRLRKRQTAMNG